jgi:hypothetical protein
MIAKSPTREYHFIALHSKAMSDVTTCDVGNCYHYEEQYESADHSPG